MKKGLILGSLMLIGLSSLAPLASAASTVISPTIQYAPSFSLDLMGTYEPGKSISVKVKNTGTATFTKDYSACEYRFSIKDKNGLMAALTPPNTMCVQMMQTLSIAPGETKEVGTWSQMTYNHCASTDMGCAGLQAPDGMYWIDFEGTKKSISITTPPAAVTTPPPAVEPIKTDTKLCTSPTNDGCIFEASDELLKVSSINTSSSAINTGDTVNIMIGGDLPTPYYTLIETKQENQAGEICVGTECKAGYLRYIVTFSPYIRRSTAKAGPVQPVLVTIPLTLQAEGIYEIRSGQKATTLEVSSPYTNVPPFRDLSSSHPNFDTIMKATAKGLVSGYPDGTFHPDRLLNRAEFMKFILEARYGSERPFNDAKYNTKCFADIEQNTWYTGYLCLAKEMGAANGYYDAKTNSYRFKPSQTITTAEVAKILTVVFGLSVEQTTVGQAWYAPYMTQLSLYGFFSGNLSMTDPMHLVTRAEAVVLIYNAFNWQNTRYGSGGY